MVRHTLFFVPALALIGQAAVARPIQFISQSRQISAHVPPEHETKSSTELGRFDESVEAHAVRDEGDGSQSDLTFLTRVTSNISESEITSVGEYVTSAVLDPPGGLFESEGIVGAYNFSTTFELLEPHHYTWSWSLRFGAFGQRDDLSVHSLWNTADEPAHERALFASGRENTVEGILEPGTYRFSASMRQDRIQGDPFGDQGFAMSLHLEPVAAIPLPAAVWPGMILLGTVVGRAIWTSRARQSVR